jgi:hypothetical protein
MRSLEELLPDFDDLEKLAIEAAKQQLESENLYRQIKDGEARCIKLCMENKELWPDKRRPADTGTYLTKVIPQLGNNEEQRQRLENLRKKYAKARAKAQECKDLLELGKRRIDVFQTLSANRRQTLAL